jgi:hypothetical protein
MFLLPPEGSISVVWPDVGIQVGILVASQVFKAGVAIILSADFELLRLADSGTKAILQ